jgi:hypothetical protein
VSSGCIFLPLWPPLQAKKCYTRSKEMKIYKSLTIYFSIEWDSQKMRWALMTYTRPPCELCREIKFGWFQTIFVLLVYNFNRIKQFNFLKICILIKSVLIVFDLGPILMGCRSVSREQRVYNALREANSRLLFTSPSAAAARREMQTHRHDQRREKWERVI